MKRSGPLGGKVIERFDREPARYTHFPTILRYSFLVSSSASISEMLRFDIIVFAGMLPAGIAGEYLALRRRVGAKQQNDQHEERRTTGQNPSEKDRTRQPPQ